MSSAFDAIKRHDLVDVLQTFLNEDKCRMARLRLSNTTINIQFGNSKTPQGDAISDTLFNIAFEKGLESLQAKVYQQNLHLQHSYAFTSHLPKELVYADDSDFPTESKEEQEHLRRIVKDTLAEFKLKVNEENTEKTTIMRRRDKKE